MVMKRPPVMIPLFGRVPEQDSRSPRLDFRGDGAFVDVSWQITLSPMFLGKREFIGKEAVRGGAGGRHMTPRHGLGWARAWQAFGDPWPSPSFLRAISPFRVKNDLREFSVLSENISLRTFLKYKNRDRKSVV